MEIDYLEKTLDYCNRKLHEVESRLTDEQEREYQAWHYRAHDVARKLNYAYAYGL